MTTPTTPIKPPTNWDSGTTPQAVVTLDPSLKPGKYTFSLMVQDDAGLESAVVFHTLELRTLPVAVLTGPAAVGVGQSITLGAEGSSASPGGKLVKFTWTLAAVP